MKNFGHLIVEMKESNRPYNYNLMAKSDHRRAKFLVTASREVHFINAYDYHYLRIFVHQDENILPGFYNASPMDIKSSMESRGFPSFIHS